jgi:alpha-glucosidase
MFKRRIFTMDPEYFPPARMREMIDYLHKHNQRYGMFHYISSSTTCDVMVSVLMTDPAVGYLPGQGYETYDRGTELDVWVKTPNGSASLGVVWPGMFY